MYSDAARRASRGQVPRGWPGCQLGLTDGPERPELDPKSLTRGARVTKHEVRLEPAAGHGMRGGGRAPG